MPQGGVAGGASASLAVVFAVVVAMAALPTHGGGPEGGIPAATDAAGGPIDAGTSAAIERGVVGVHGWESPAVRPDSGGWRFDVNRTISVGTGKVVSGNIPNLPNALDPWSVTYDNTTDQYFVCGSASDQVVVYWASNLSIAAWVSTYTPNHGSNHAQPLASVYDPATREVYVANSALNTVSVISDVTDMVVATIIVGSEPDALAFDNLTGQVFSANVNSGNVSVISTASHRAVASVPVEPTPTVLLFDPPSRHLFVGSGYPENLTVISDLNDSVVQTLNLSAEVDALALDPGTDTVFAAVGSLSEVDALNASSGTLLKTVYMGGQFPDALAFDPETSQLFVAEWWSADTIEVLTVPGYSVAASIATSPYPLAVTYLGGGQLLAQFPYIDTLCWIYDSNDSLGRHLVTGVSVSGLVYGSSSNEVYVTDAFSSILRAFGSNWSLAASIPVGSGPTEPVEDPQLGQILVLDSSGSNVSIVDESTDTPVSSLSIGYGPYAVGYAAGSREIFFTSYQNPAVTAISDVTHSVAFTTTVPDPVTGFAEDSGTSEMYATQWGNPSSILPIAESTGKAGTAISIDTPGSMAYDPTDRAMYVTDWNSGVKVVSDATHSIVASIPVGQFPNSGPGALAFDPALDAIAVTVADTNSLEVISAATNSVVANVPVGFAPTSVAYDPAEESLLVGNYISGSISEVVQNLTPVPFPVTFHVTPDGCPPAVLNGTTEPLGAPVPLYAGNYTLTIGACANMEFAGWSTSGEAGVLDPSSTVTVLSVLGGANVTARFVSPTYPVYLNETGLPAGSTWTATLGGWTIRGSGPSLSTWEPNGSYGYQVLTNSGYAPDPGSGTLSVNGAPASAAIHFTPTSAQPRSFVVTFAETGLPLGTAWGVSLNETNVTGNQPSLSVRADNGTYLWAVLFVVGEDSSPGNGTVTVAGANETINITFFAKILVPPNRSAQDLPLNSILALTAIAVLAVIVALLVWRGRRRRRPQQDR